MPKKAKQSLSLSEDMDLQSQNDELRVLVDVLQQKICELEKMIETLKGELEELKKLPENPKLKASKLKSLNKKEKGLEKRAGSEKRSKKETFEVDEETKIEPPELPEGAKLKQYRQYDVQELSIKRKNIRFLLGEYELADGRRVRAELPTEYQQTGHYGPTLVSYILYEYYQNRVALVQPD